MPEDNNFARKLKSIVTRPRVFFAVLILSGLTILASLVAIISGIDQQLIPTYLEGKVFDEQGQLLAEASIEIEGNFATTDAQGYFKLENISYGLRDVHLERNGYSSLTEELKITRFRNYKDFTLIVQEFGEIKFILVPAENEINLQEMAISINDQQLKIEPDGSFSTGRLLVDTYKFVLTSPYYVNLSSDLVIEPGIYEQDLPVTSSGDIITQSKDWLTNSVLTVDKVEQKTGDNYQDITASSRNGDKIVIADVLVDNELELKFSKQGYNELLIKVKVAQGVNSLGEIKLVPVGKTIVAQYDGTSTQFSQTNLDGSKATPLSKVTGYCQNSNVQNADYVFQCSGNVFVHYQNGSTPKLINSLTYTGETAYYSIELGKVFVINNSDEPQILLQDWSEKSTTVYEGDAHAISVITTADKVYYSTRDGIYLYKNGKSEKVTEGVFSIEDSFQNDLLLKNTAVSGESSLWILDTNNNEKRRITFLPNSYDQVGMINAGELFYVTTNHILYKYNISAVIATQIATDIDWVGVLDERGWLLSNTSAKMYIYSSQTSNSTEIKVTN